MMVWCVSPRCSSLGDGGFGTATGLGGGFTATGSGAVGWLWHPNTMQARAIAKGAELRTIPMRSDLPASASLDNVPVEHETC